MSDDHLQAVYRILDASANRAGEGMRTLEEFARFVRCDAKSSESWKALRHDLATTINRIPREDLLRARDTPGDVGTGIGHPSEYQRQDLASVVAAAATRTQQALRTLEEYAKTIDPTAAAELEQIRYRCYTLAANLELQSASDQRRLRLQNSYLYALIDCDASEENFSKHVTGLARAGVDLFQLRDPGVDDRTLLARSRVGTEMANIHGAMFIVNDRPDIAAASGADGVHVGQEELPVAETRRIVGTQRLIGVSTHSIDQARQAVSDGADYIGCGPVFPGRTKQFDQFPGTEFLLQIASEIRLPAFAIGGIDLQNVTQVINSGIRRVAITGAIRDAEDPEVAASEWKRLLVPTDSSKT